MPVYGPYLFWPVQDAQGGGDDGVPHVAWHAWLAAQGVQQARGEGGGAISGHLWWYCGGTVVGDGGEVATFVMESFRDLSQGPSQVGAVFS